MTQYQKEKQLPLTAFIQTLLPVLPMSMPNAANTSDLSLLTTLSQKKELDESDLAQISKIVPLILMSDKKYQFMRGQNAVLTRSEILASMKPTQGDSA